MSKEELKYIYKNYQKKTIVFLSWITWSIYARMANILNDFIQTFPRSKFSFAELFGQFHNDGILYHCVKSVYLIITTSLNLRGSCSTGLMWIFAKAELLHRALKCLNMPFKYPLSKRYFYFCVTQSRSISSLSVCGNS